MAKKGQAEKQIPPSPTAAVRAGKPSALLDTRVVYCGDNFEQITKLPDGCVDLAYIDWAPVSKVELPFNSNRNHELFRGETKGKRFFDDRTPARKPTSTTCGPAASHLRSPFRG